MGRQFIVDYGQVLTRMAIVKNGVVTHFYLDHPNYEMIQDRIVVGQVEKVVKNLKAAFIDYGEEKKGLLHLKHIPAYYQNKVQQGARIPVQIKKHNDGEKGHKLTGYLNIQGYYLVCMVDEKDICLSKKIIDPVVRKTLKEALSQLGNNRYGFMVRTKAKDVPLELILKEANYLIEEADKLTQAKDLLSKGSILVKEQHQVIQHAMSCVKMGEPLEIIGNNKILLDEIQKRFTQFGLNEWVSYTYYDLEENVFTRYSLEKVFEETFKRKVWLKNGGNIIIDETEAMTVIDVNSSKAIMGKNVEKSVMALNKLAIDEAILQILRRNLAGIIILDLVDVKGEASKEELFLYAKSIIASYDKETFMVYPMTELGLMQFSRTKKYARITEVLGEQKKLDKHYLLLDLVQIERQIKHLCKETIQKAIYLYAGQGMYHHIKEKGLDYILSNTYGISIDVALDNKKQWHEVEVKYHKINHS